VANDWPRGKTVLARIIRQAGSAPRTVGPGFSSRRTGFVGTIGGGLLERDVLRTAQEVLSSGDPVS